VPSIRARKRFASPRGTELKQETVSTKQPQPPKKRRETLQEKSARALAIAGALGRSYADLECLLTHRNHFELLAAVILSAQCTDAAVNKVTPELFRRFPDPPAMARASTDEIAAIIRTLGLFRAKAKSLQRCARQLVEDFSGEVPSAMEDLTKLTGVGRKTANVIRGHAFVMPGIAVDTHCGRLARRLGLTRQQDPVKVEHDLSKILPAQEWTDFSHRLILHGRQVCYARKPACERCVLSDLCPSSGASDR